MKKRYLIPGLLLGILGGISTYCNLTRGFIVIYDLLSAILFVLIGIILLVIGRIRYLKVRGK